MPEFGAVKMIPFSAAIAATGDGYWGLEKDFIVNFSACAIHVIGFEDGGGCTELRFCHQKIPGGALPYTDNGIQDGIRKIMQTTPGLTALDPQNTGGSEMGMQGSNFFSCDSEWRVPNYIPKYFRERGFTLDI